MIVGNRQELKAEALNHLDKNLILDLSETGYVDASGLGVLVTISHCLRDRGKRLVIVDISPDLAELFELTKMNTVLQCAATEDAALDLILRREIDDDTPPPRERKQYQPYDLLEFPEARDWWGCSTRTLERMNLPWSYPTRAKGGRMRRIMFKDLVAHYERRKIG